MNTMGQPRDGRKTVAYRVMAADARLSSALADRGMRSGQRRGEEGRKDSMRYTWPPSRSVSSALFCACTASIRLNTDTPLKHEMSSNVFASTHIYDQPIIELKPGIEKGQDIHRIPTGLSACDDVEHSRDIARRFEARINRDKSVLAREHRRLFIIFL